ncbi:MAG: hypothetical protein Kow00120_28450 [Anaerolineae bacterium]
MRADFWAENIIHTCLRIRNGESVLIITDQPLLELHAQLAGEVLKLDPAEVWTYTVPDAARPLRDFPQELLDAAARADVVLALHASLDAALEGQRVLHLRDALSATGRGRMAGGFYITPDILAREMAADYAAIAATTERLAAELESGGAARLTAPGGADLTLTLAPRSAQVETGLVHRAGQFGSLPGGLCHLSVTPGAANGVLVIDRALHGALLAEPVRLTVEAGCIVAVEGGGAEAGSLLARLHSDDAGAGCALGQVVGLGVGANPEAQLRGNPATDSKALGAVSVTLAQNGFFKYDGWGINARQLVGVIGESTLVVDDQTVVARGACLI